MLQVKILLTHFPQVRFPFWARILRSLCWEDDWASLDCSVFLSKQGFFLLSLANHLVHITWGLACVINRLHLRAGRWLHSRSIVISACTGLSAQKLMSSLTEIQPFFVFAKCRHPQRCSQLIISASTLTYIGHVFSVQSGVGCEGGWSTTVPRSVWTQPDSLLSSTSHSSQCGSQDVSLLRLPSFHII